MVFTIKSPISKDSRKGSFPSTKAMCGGEAEKDGPGPGRFLSRSEDSLDGVGPAPQARKGSNPAVTPSPSTAPLRESVNTGVAARASPTERAISKRRAASQQADVRINKTKLTVTELQKAKQGLESQLSELTRKAEARQAEMAALRMELRQAKEDAHQVPALRQSVQELQVRLGDRVTEPDEMRRETTPVRAVVCEPAPELPASDSEPSMMQPSSSVDWDRQSQTSEVSVACLQDRIVQMEETHYSTSEELQATLQELTDLQDIVNDLSKDNQAAQEERNHLQRDLEVHTNRLDQAKLQIQHLKHLLLSGLHERQVGKGRNQSDAGEDTDREQQLLQVLKATHEEHEDLKSRYVDLRKSYQAAVDEARERVEMSEVGRDRSRLLERQLASAEEERIVLGNQLSQAEQRHEVDRREVARLSTLVEQGRARLQELQRQAVSGSDTELILESSQRDKAEAETELASLRHQLAGERTKLAKAEKALASLKEELLSTDSLNKDLEQRLTDFHKEKIYDRNRITDTEQARAELEERCRRLAEDKAELKASVLTLQHHLDEVAAERDSLTAMLEDIRSTKTEQELEWRQFQADLQTAVVVANDLKLEAQSDIERLSEENSSLRLKLSSSKEELERLKLRQKGRPAPATSSSLSVKTLIKSLENTSPGSPRVPLRAPSPVGNSLSSRHSNPDPGLSKSSTNLSGTRPASLALSATGSPAEGLKAATSDTELRRPANSVSVPAVGSDSARTLPSIPSTIPEATPSRPRGILQKTTPPSATSTARKAVYLDPEKKDPLAKLMKDAPRGSRRNALLKWSQGRTAGYKNVEITNFSSSWNDGLAFCALLDSYVPSKIHFKDLDPRNKRGNFELALRIGSELGIPCGLSANELVALERPDWSSIITYVTDIYTHFNPEAV